MKKVIALILALVMALALVACGDKTDAKDDTPSTDGANTIYVMGPTPDHGWTAQAGA